MFNRCGKVQLSLALVLAGCVVVSGCSGGKVNKEPPKPATTPKVDADKSKTEKDTKITKENADKIQVGMAEKEVMDLLGPPTETAEVTGIGSGAKVCTWKSGTKTIAITFMDGKVSNKVVVGL